jgi:hypothetical protein
MTRKPADLSAGLVAIKGKASPAADMPTRAGAITPRAADDARTEELVPLNFKLPASFRRDFKTYAATHDMKLNELLRRSFEGYRKQQGD